MGLMRAVTKHITKVKDAPSWYKADFLFCSTTDLFLGRNWCEAVAAVK